jgi:hypothetical protein
VLLPPLTGLGDNVPKPDKRPIWACSLHIHTELT